jgi:hypothetical protein
LYYSGQGLLLQHEIGQPGSHSMKAVVIRYRARGSSDPWREIKLNLDADETIADGISRFEDENYGTIEIAPTEPSIRLVHRRES